MRRDISREERSVKAHWKRFFLLLSHVSVRREGGMYVIIRFVRFVY